MSSEESSPSLSLLAARLPEGVSNLTELSDLIMWQTISEVVQVMHDIIDDETVFPSFDAFDAAAALLYHEYLNRIKKAIDEAAEKKKYGKDDSYLGYEDTLNYIKACRTDLGMIVRFHGTDNHQKALDAVTTLQNNLKRALGYINPICNQLESKPPGTASNPPDSKSDSPGSKTSDGTDVPVH